MWFFWTWFAIQHIRYFFFDAKAFTFINHPLIHRIVVIPFATLHQNFFKMDFIVLLVNCTKTTFILNFIHSKKLQKLMMVIYNPINDAWNQFDLNTKNDKIFYYN